MLSQPDFLLLKKNTKMDLIAATVVEHSNALFVKKGTRTWPVASSFHFLF